MKKFRKITSLIVAMVMVFAMTGQAFAANITISGNGDEYKAYRLLNATDGGEEKIAYTLNSKYTSVLQSVTKQTEQADIIDYISGLDEESEIRTFANAVYALIKNMDADETTDTGVFESVEQGYYLIVESELSDIQDTYSLVMLDTAGKENVTVTSKEDAPTLTKTVEEVNDTTGDNGIWQDAADYDIGDSVSFKLEGTVSGKLDDYQNAYYYAFHDTLANGLMLDAESIVVKIDEVVVEDYTLVTETKDGCSFEIVFENLKNTVANANSKITVEYEATLTSSAVIGAAGNTNTAHLEYSNDPYGTTKGTSVDDKVIVFTYQLKVDKKDGTTRDALSGAGFTLYKYDKTAGIYNPVGSEIKGTEQNPITEFTFQGLDAGQYKLVESMVPAGYNKVDDLIFVIDSTYDAAADDPTLAEIEIKDADGNSLTEGDDPTFTVTVATGMVNTIVLNFSGAELPSTGGIGTTIFYAAGIILMAGAVFFVVRRKRA